MRILPGRHVSDVQAACALPASEQASRSFGGGSAAHLKSPRSQTIQRARRRPPALSNETPLSVLDGQPVLVRIIRGPLCHSVARHPHQERRGEVAPSRRLGRQHANASQARKTSSCRRNKPPPATARSARLKSCRQGTARPRCVLTPAKTSSSRVTLAPCFPGKTDATLHFMGRAYASLTSPQRCPRHLGM